MDKIEILDSSLRDGAQNEKISYSVQDKLAIAQLLKKIGIDYIEVGVPLFNPKDANFFNKVDKSLAGSIAAFTHSRKLDEPAASSPALLSAINSSADTVTLLAKASKYQVENILKVPLTQNIEMINSSIAMLKANNKKVILDAEHFFDGYQSHPEYAMAVLVASKNADVLCLCDTNGANLPDVIERITAEIVASFPNNIIGIHCHDDIGLATANTISAVTAGARHIQGTFIGTGERCGNANLSTIIPTLQLKCGYKILSDEHLANLTSTAKQIAEISNITLNAQLPYVGHSAFAHKAGMHIDGVIKDTKSFEHINPVLIGNTRKLLLSEISGKATVTEKLKAFLPNSALNDEQITQLITTLKMQESLGYQYEGAEASFKLLVLRTLKNFSPSFKLVSFKCISEQPAIAGTSATATVKIEALNKMRLQVAEGAGPVHAIDKALRACLAGFYPQVENILLVDYKVRVLSSGDATAAKVRVLITSSNKKDTWTTVGVSADVIEASWIALVDSFEYIISINSQYNI